MLRQFYNIKYILKSWGFSNNFYLKSCLIKININDIALNGI